MDKSGYLRKQPQLRPQQATWANQQENHKLGNAVLLPLSTEKVNSRTQVGPDDGSRSQLHLRHQPTSDQLSCECDGLCGLYLSQPPEKDDGGSAMILS